MSASEGHDALPHTHTPRDFSDEEIDSDLASLSSMDLPLKNKVATSDHDLSADEHSESDPCEGEGILLSDMLSVAADARNKSVSETAKKLTVPAPEHDYSDELPEEIFDADDDDSEADQQKLADVVFAATNRRDLDKRRMREARTVAPVVGEEAIHSAPGTQTVSQREMMQRMLSTLGKAGDGDKGLAIGQLEKKIARLHSDGKKQLAVPLPAPVQGRIARAAAYEKVTESISDKWGRVVKDNRKAEHLVFPLNGGGTKVGRNSSDIAGHFQPINEYEEEIEKLLVEAGVASEKQVIQGEKKAMDDLGVSEVSKEEIMERRRQMAKMRSLMFHYERKMKRIKKIKSKKYRRLMKKEREKVAGMVGSDDEEEALLKAERRRAEERMTLRHKNTSKWVRRKLSRVETKREGDTKAAIEEQLRLHQELMKKQGVAVDSDDSDAEDSAEDESETEEALQKKLKDIESDLVKEDAREKKPKGVMGMRFMQAAQERQRKEALELLKTMKESEDSDEDGEIFVRFKGKRYFNVDTPKSDPEICAEQEEVEAPGLIENGEDDVEDLAERIQEAYADSAKSKSAGEKSSKKDKKQAGDKKRNVVEVKAVRVANRTDTGVETESNPWLKARDEGKAMKSAKDSAKPRKGKVGERDVRDAVGRAEREKKNKNKDKKRAKGADKSAGQTNGVQVAAEAEWDKESNAWVNAGLENIKVAENDESGIDEVKNEAKIGHALDSAGNGLKRKKRSVENGANGKEGGMEMGSNPWLKDGPGSSTRSKSKKTKRKREKAAKDGEVKRARSENTEDAIARMRQVAAAFAGAGGAEEEDFEKAKMEHVEEGLPEASDVQAEVLPGWGKWDGAGVKARKTESAFARAAKQRLAEARRSAVGARKDAKLKHVILEERRVKQATQLTMAQVPFPFAKREEWEMEVRTPVCSELMTGERFAKFVRPRVCSQVGAAIDPIAETAGSKRAVLKMRKARAEKRDRARRGLMV